MSAETISALLPCPFCGGSVHMKRRSGNVGRVCPSRYYREHVRCEKCGAMGPEGKSPNSSVRRWNKIADRATRPTELAAPVPGGGDEAGDELVRRLLSEADAMHLAPSGEPSGGTFHAFNWDDKPHRVLFDAVKLIREAASALTTERTARIEAEEACQENASAWADEMAARIAAEERAKAAERERGEAKAGLVEAIAVLAELGVEKHAAETQVRSLTEQVERAEDDGLKAAISFVEGLWEAYAREFGIYDPSTNATEFSGAAEDVDLTYAEIMDGLRALRSPVPQGEASSRDAETLADNRSHE